MSLTQNNEQENSNYTSPTNTEENESEEDSWAEIEREAALYDRSEGAVNDSNVELAYDMVMEKRLKNKMKLYEDREKAYKKIMTIKISCMENKEHDKDNNNNDGWSQELYDAINAFKIAEAALNKKS